jgi:hypothetical protein
VHTSGAFVPFHSAGTVAVVHNGFFFPHNHGFVHNNVFFHGCFGCFNPFFFNSGFFFGSPFVGFGFGFAGGPFVGPWGYPYYGGYPYGYPSDYYAPPPPQPVVSNDNSSSNDVELAASVQRLSDEVEDLRSQNREQSSRPEGNPNESISAKQPGLPAVFIFKDGRKISAQNYAIAGETLWIMDEHAAYKYALADIDVTSTEHANAVNGVEIHIPAPPAKP